MLKIKRFDNLVTKSDDSKHVDYVSNVLNAVMGSLKQLYYLNEYDWSNQPKQRGPGTAIQDIEVPSLYKLKRADYYISAQDTSSGAMVTKPLKLKVDEISLFPIEHDSFEWCSHHLKDNPYLADMSQLYYHMIPDK